MGNSSRRGKMGRAKVAPFRGRNAMERPIMNPTTFYEDHKRSGKRSRFAWLWRILGGVMGVVQFCFSNPFSLRPKAKVSGVPHTLGWWVRGITYRLLFAPVLVVLAVAA